MGSGGWLVHWDHVAGIEDSQEFEVLLSLESTSGFTIDVPVFIFGTAEVLVTSPVNNVGPGFSTSPVADEIFISGVDESVESSVQEVGNLW